MVVLPQSRSQVWLLGHRYIKACFEGEGVSGEVCAEMGVAHTTMHSLGLLWPLNKLRLPVCYLEKWISRFKQNVGSLAVVSLGTSQSHPRLR